MDETRVENLNLGHATAYGYAKAKGYEGTEEEFAQLCANLGIDIEQLENMTVIINMLDPDADPSGTYSDGVLTLNLPRGVKGDTGESAYEYAVAGGYTGTEEEFQQLCADLGIEVDHLKNMTVVVNMVAPSVQPSATYVDGTLTINIQSATAEQVSTAADAWLAQNITNPSNPPLDRSLTLENAAAPADMVGDLKSATNSKVSKNAISTEQSANMFDPDVLLEADGITIDSNGYFSGTASAFATNFGPSTGVPGLVFDSNARYSFSATAYCDSNASSGGGLRFRFYYSDGSYSTKSVDLSTTTPTLVSFTSDNNKSVSKFVFTYGAGASVVWHVKDLMLAKSATAQEFVPHLTPVDTVARSSVVDTANILRAETDAKLSTIGDNPYTWVNGQPSASTGTMSYGESKSKRITSEFIPISDVKSLAIYSTETYIYEGLLFRYSTSGYVGVLTGGNAEDGYTWGDSGALAIRGIFDFARMRQDYPYDVFRLAIRKKYSGDFVDITPSEATNVSFILLNQPQNSIYSVIDTRWNAIAYSDVTGISDAPINSIEHYKYIATQYSSVFTAIKGDIRVTSDNHMIMCHDDGFTFDGNGRITTYDSSNKTLIHDMTYSECMALEYATQWNGAYPHVCDFETFLGICKAYGKTCYTVVRDEYIDDIVDELVATIKTMSMQDNIIINSFTYASLRIINTKCSELMLSWIVDNGDLTEDIIDDAAAFRFPMLCLFDWGGSRTKWNALDDYKEAGLLTYAISKNVRLYEAIVKLSDDMTLDAFMRRSLTYGITGAQISGLTAADIPT